MTKIEIIDCENLNHKIAMMISDERIDFADFFIEVLKDAYKELDVPEHLKIAVDNFINGMWEAKNTNNLIFE